MEAYPWKFLFFFVDVVVVVIGIVDVVNLKKLIWFVGSRLPLYLRSGSSRKSNVRLSSEKKEIINNKKPTLRLSNKMFCKAVAKGSFMECFWVFYVKEKLLNSEISASFFVCFNY
jgi:hypothetical protein